MSEYPASYYRLEVAPQRRELMMIRLIDQLPDNVIGFEAVGEVRASDYDTVLDPAVDAAL